MYLWGSSQLLSNARQIFNSVDLGRLAAHDISRNTFDYELIYYYPPARTLEPINPSDVFPADVRGNAIKRQVGMYVHLPFCTGRCSFCHYVFFTNPKQDIIDQYLETLKRELQTIARLRSAAGEIINLHFGGGTPTFLDEAQMEDIMSFIRSNFDVSKDIEITWESTPETIIGNHTSKLHTLISTGVNRLNIGIQAFSDHLLKLCNRRHSAQEAEEAINGARKAGFKNINVDVIYGLPDQSINDWEYTLEMIKVLRPESVTVYPLRAFPGTNIARLPPEHFVSKADFLWMQIYGYEKLKSIGYIHYQPDQFALSAEKNVHQYLMDRWSKGLEFIGVGISAYGFMNGHIYYNHRTFDEYVKAVRDNKLSIHLGKKLSTEQQMSKIFVLGLKDLLSGVNQDHFRDSFGKTIEEVFGRILEKLEQLGLIDILPNVVKLSPTGVLFADEVCSEFYTEEEKEKLKVIKANRYGTYLPYLITGRDGQLLINITRK